VKHAWSPLRHPTFRAMWMASVVSNVGTWMHTVAASWLMTTLATSPLPVALVTTATTLPVFLLGLPSGAFADLIDRRRILLFTQSWMLAVAALLGVMTVMHAVGPWSLLALTFALGLGSTMNGPAWSATVPELVPREELPSAVALNSVGFNIARAVGPALGGIVMAASNAGVVFLLNGVSFLGVIAVLWRWKYARHQPDEHPDKPSPKLREAMRVGLDYVRTTRAYHSVLTRAGLFAFGGSALWAMLPVVVSAGENSTATHYGILLGCLGAGSIVGATMLAPLRVHFSADQLAGTGVVVFAMATAALALLHQFLLVSLAMLIGGVAWMTVMSTFNVCAQMAPPRWLRARALAYYLLVFQGSMAIGSGVWGAIAGRIGVRSSLLLAAAMIAAGVFTIDRLPLLPEVLNPSESVFVEENAVGENNVA
jgi:MFS family permease